jgi:hypothetical protein
MVGEKQIIDSSGKKRANNLEMSFVWFIFVENMNYEYSKLAL